MECAVERERDDSERRLSRRSSLLSVAMPFATLEPMTG
jgi:hypothetical protein